MRDSVPFRLLFEKVNRQPPWDWDLIDAWDFFWLVRPYAEQVMFDLNDE